MDNKHESAPPRAIAFIDGQNLFHGAKEAFGYHYPNFDVKKLSEEICSSLSYGLTECRFYTGVHEPTVEPFWYEFWARKTAQMGRQGVTVITRTLKYQRVKTVNEEGKEEFISVGNEKGIDVRIALDMVRLARANFYDAVLLFSQDQDLAEATDEVKGIAQEMKRFIHLHSAYPVSATSKNKRGVNRTNWFKIDQTLYDQCLDPRDYRS